MIPPSLSAVAGGSALLLYRVAAAWGGSLRGYRGSLALLADPDAPPIRWLDGGEEHLVVLQQDGSAIVHGASAEVPPEAAKPGGCDFVAAGKYHSVCVTPRGGIIQWGEHPDWTESEKIVPDTVLDGAIARTSKVKTVGCGTKHSVALLDHEVVVW